MRIRLFSAIILSMFCGFSMAAEINWSSYPYSLYSKQDSLRDILTGLAASENIPVEVSDSVQDVISANFENLTRGEIFRQLVEAYGLAWYYDGHRLYIDRLENTKAATIQLKAMSVAAFKQHLKRLKILDEDYKYGWQSIDHKRLIYISGPAPFVKRVNEMARVLDDSSRAVQTIYKWTDESGITHYSSDAEEAPSKARIIEVQSKSMSILPTAQMGTNVQDGIVSSAAGELPSPPSEAISDKDEPVLFRASSSK